jgi:hypothetical protein
MLSALLDANSFSVNAACANRFLVNVLRVAGAAGQDSRRDHADAASASARGEMGPTCNCVRQSSYACFIAAVALSSHSGSMCWQLLLGDRNMLLADRAKSLQDAMRCFVATVCTCPV